MKSMKLGDIRTDGKTQVRLKFSQETANDYAEGYKAGNTFPAVVVFFDGMDYWLADGHHRHAAAELAGLEEIQVDIHQGTQKDAREYACAANNRHGLRASLADRKNAARIMLEDYPHKSDRSIGDHCGVDGKTVASIRATLSPAENPHLREGADGKTYTIPKKPRIPMPPLEPGKYYAWDAELWDAIPDGYSDGMHMEMMECPHKPGKWCFLIYRVVPKGHPLYNEEFNGYFMEFNTRGVHLKGQHIWYKMEPACPENGNKMRSVPIPRTVDDDRKDEEAIAETWDYITRNMKASPKTKWREKDPNFVERGIWFELKKIYEREAAKSIEEREVDRIDTDSVDAWEKSYQAN